MDKKEYIERGALLEKSRWVTEYDEGGWGIDYRAVSEEEIENTPAADVVEVVHGEWLKSKWGYPDRTLTCSVCGFEYDSTDYNTSKFEQKVLPHCPVCIAKMDGGKE